MAKKTSSKKTGKTKKELLDAAVGESVRAGKELHLESVDFTDPNRPKTCLEVDFPILLINHIAVIEGNAGKPIYQMSKWWARRRSSVFRSMLIAAATKAPEDPGEAAKLVWDSYYGNHQQNKEFKKLKVADIFMGGGTTIVEGARLGMQMFGNDLNPVAWFVVKNELAQVSPPEIQKLLDHVEADVKPQIMPFYACDCPRGHKGKWTQLSTGKVMGKTFDPLALKSNERADYKYEGPELIYTFWAKHGPCHDSDCKHRTPIVSSPTFALKTLTVKAWEGKHCRKCKKVFDVELTHARLAPRALFVIADTERPFAVMDESGNYTCPHCHNHTQDERAVADGHSSVLGKAQNKKITLTLLIHPDWLKGTPGTLSDGRRLGGSVNDSPEMTAAWNSVRAKSLKLVEIRGILPEKVTCPDTGEQFFTDERSGTTPKEKQFACHAPTCGKSQDIVVSVEKTGTSAPVAVFAIQGNCPECSRIGDPYGGRFFDIPDTRRFDAANSEWETLKEKELKAYWPKSRIPEGYMSPIQNDLPAHGLPDFANLFNSRQLLLLTRLYRSIVTSDKWDWTHREFVLGAFQQYLRNQSMLSFWHRTKDHFAPALSNCNYHPKTTSIEVGAFNPVGYGPWPSAIGSLSEASSWMRNPWELLPTSSLETIDARLAEQVTTKSIKVYPNDPVLAGQTITCGSSSHMPELPNESLDLVITDPPFGGLMQYAEVADFFHVWLRLILKDRYPAQFEQEYTPKALEAVANEARNPEDSNPFYQRIMTECWKEAFRVLKPSGLLAFTFHHGLDDPWVAVLESLFDAGFYLEAAYPIRSDETKGDGQFGSKTIEFDIIHVCRKRLDEPQPVSWARLRKQIMVDVRQLQEILEQHQKGGLGEADLRVIRRGKALEYFSRHYGKVYIEKGREADFTVRDALLGINQLLDDQRDSSSEVPPVDAEPYTRQFLRLFADAGSLPRDQMQKFLRGTGVSPAEFIERGWCNEEKRIFHLTPPLEQARKWKGLPRKGLGRDLDQAMFLIGACYENSGINMNETLNNPNFMPHLATGGIIDWFTRHGGDSQMKAAARLAKQLYTKWVAANEPKVKAAQRTFDFADEEA